MLSALLLVLPALAGGTDEINASFAWVGADNADWHVFSDADVMMSGGLRLGYGLTEHLTLTAGWQHTAIKRELWLGTQDDSLSPELRFHGDQVQVGVKSGFRMFPGFAPYATVQAAALIGGARMDDDIEDDENPGEVKELGFTAGGAAAIGIDFPIDLGSSGVAITPYAELGYGLFAPLKLGDLGKVPVNGLAGQAGIGLRF